MLTNKQKGDVAEQYVVGQLMSQGYDVYVLQNESGQGVDAIADRGDHVRVVEVKANTARFNQFQKFGGNDFFGERLTIAAHGESGYTCTLYRTGHAPDHDVSVSGLVSRMEFVLGQRGGDIWNQADIDRYFALPEHLRETFAGRPKGLIKVDFECARITLDESGEVVAADWSPWTRR